jgi:outer membrane beta-barrel protein
MESRIQHFLVAGLLLTPGLAVAATDPGQLDLEPLVVREPERREIRVEKIDSENFEVGGFAGVMSVEDFGTNTLYGLRAAYHVTEDLFVEAVYGETELGETSFERLSGNVQILEDDDRDMSYYNLSVGFNVFPGEVFIGRGLAFKGGLYLIGGAGSTDFAGDEHFTVNFGVGYRLAATDWLALRIDVRDHMFETDLLGSEELTHNIEFSGGLTIFF